jgi:hypothetical protein
VQSDGPHLAYADTKRHLQQQWYTVSSGQWAAQDLTYVPGMALVGSGSPMTSWVQSDGPHFIYGDANAHVEQLWYTISPGMWAAELSPRTFWTLLRELSSLTCRLTIVLEDLSAALCFAE